MGLQVKTIIHVNQHVIRKNLKEPDNIQPPLTVKTYKNNTYASQADIVKDGEVVASIIYRPDKPLSCGARVWIETKEEVVTL